MVTRPAINDSASDSKNISANVSLIIDVEGALKTHYAPFSKWPKWGQRLAGWLLRLIICQNRINRFLAVHGQLHAYDFIEKIFDEVGFCYQINTGEMENIPAKGGVVIIANHPLGALDGLSLVHMVGQVRRDVKIVANQLLSSIPPIAPLLLPVNNLAGESRWTDLQNISRALEEGQAVIFFPAGEVSRLSPRGIRDREWDSGFLRFAERLNIPVLPIYIRARNSSLFYTISHFSAVLSMLMLPREMIKTSGQLHFFTSPVIRPEQFSKMSVSRKQKVKLFRKHIYQLAKGRQPVFVTQASIIHPVDRQALKAELTAAEELGKTSDNKRILLCSVQSGSALLEELGRLREEAFRAVGEGTGRKKDIDRFDPYYRHIIVWDEELLEIAGAYRLGEVWKWYAELTADHPEKDCLAEQELVDKLYSAELFEFDGEMDRVFGAGLELGRSFVQPRFWGKRSLDYLWQGIGAYVARHQEVRFLFGSVSLSASLPPRARNMLVWYYQSYYKDGPIHALPKNPFKLSVEAENQIESLMTGSDIEADFAAMREQLSHMQINIPTLYRQYADLCDTGGVSFSAFNVDDAFSMCLDSFVMVDLTAIKPAKYERYVQLYLDKPKEARARPPRQLVR